MEMCKSAKKEEKKRKKKEGCHPKVTGGVFPSWCYYQEKLHKFSTIAKYKM